jgi:putative peptidoglycan lipid II flippase
VRFRTTVRWALERMALFVLPVTAAMVAVALPAMRAVSFGETTEQGPGLLAAAVASLAVGLLPYGAFLLLARAYYALGDSRTPGIVALWVSGAGVVVMVVGAVVADGAALVALLGAGHSVAYGIGSLVLLRGLGRRTGGSVLPTHLGEMVGLAAAVGAVVWLAVAQLDDGTSVSRLRDLVTVAAAALGGGALVVAGYRILGLPGQLTARTRSGPDGAPHRPPVPGQNS